MQQRQTNTLLKKLSSVSEQHHNQLPQNSAIRHSSSYEIKKDKQLSSSNTNFPPIYHPNDINKPSNQLSLFHPNSDRVFSIFDTLHQKLQSLQAKINIFTPLTKTTISLQTDNLPLAKAQKSINQQQAYYISNVQNNLSVSINYFNHQLCQKQKQFNKQYQQTTRTIIENNSSIIEMKNGIKELDYKGMDQKIKMLMRCENKCDELLSAVDGCVERTKKNVEERKRELEKGRTRVIDGVEYEVVEVSEEELMEMILEEYQVDIHPEMHAQMQMRGQMGVSSYRGIQQSNYNTRRLF